MVFWFFRKKRDPHSRIDELKDGLEASFALVKKDIGTAGKWISHFKERHEEHDRKIEKILGKLEVLESNVAEISDHVQRRESGRSIAIDRDQLFDRSGQSFNHNQSLHSVRKLTPRQEEIFKLLVASDGPLDFESIGRAMGISVVTVRRHVNDIKRTGVDVKEKMSVETRRKLVYVDKLELRNELRKVRIRKKNKK